MKITNIILFDDVRYIDIYNDNDDLDGNFLKEAFEREKVVFPQSDIEQVLSKLRQCDEIHSEDYYKTARFMNENNLTENDCLQIIHNLTFADYRYNMESTNNNHRNSNLMVFKPRTIVNGDSIVVYIKIDYDETTDKAIALVSIHKNEHHN